MKFLIVGGDMRNLEIANILAKAGYTCRIYGLEKLENKHKNIQNATAISTWIKGCDGVILPVPVSKDGVKVNAPYSEDDIFLAEIFSSIEKNTRVFGGVINPKLMEAVTLRGIKIYDYMDDERVKIRNAQLTAEGTVELVIKLTKKGIFGSNILVCGYGRIGKFVAKYLNAMGGNVTVSSRKDEVLTEAFCNRYQAVKTQNIGEKIDQFDLIINTVPALIFDEKLLKKCNGETKIIDLASAPGGVDFDRAKELQIDVIHALSLPGKTAPISSAQIITNYILDSLNEE